MVCKYPIKIVKLNSEAGKRQKGATSSRIFKNFKVLSFLFLFIRAEGRAEAFSAG